MQADLVELVEIAPNAYIDVPEETPERRGYTDLTELKDCIEAFFKGTLDDVFDLTRLWMPLHQLIPGKRLESQLDSDTMRRCLYRLSEAHRTAIALSWEDDDPDLLQTMGHYFVHSQAQGFADFCSDMYADALISLAGVIYEAL